MQERLSPCRDAAQVSVEVEMSAESNKTIVGRLYEEVANNGKLDLLDELAVPDFEEHSPLPGQPGGIEGLKFRIASILTGFHPKYTLHRVIAEDDMVAVYWTMTGTHQGDVMGIPPTGRTVTFSGIDLALSDHIHFRLVYPDLVENFEATKPLARTPAYG